MSHDVRMSRRTYRFAFVTIGFAVVTVSGCSRADSDAGSVTSAVATTSVASTATESTASTPSGQTEPGGTQPIESIPPNTFQPIPDDQVPGLNSPDAFCSSWSRFGGSFTIIAPMAAFGENAAKAEILAAPTMVEAFDEMVVNWPSDLEAVRDSIQADSLGPLVERMRRNQQYLIDAGATEEDLAEIRRTWGDVLALYNPSEPPPSFDVPGNLGELVAAAAVTQTNQDVPFNEDPQLVTDRIPEFDQYLTANCPDLGTLAGEDVQG